MTQRKSLLASPQESATRPGENRAFSFACVTTASCWRSEARTDNIFCPPQGATHPGK